MANEVQTIKENGSYDERVIVPVADIYETENEYVIKTDMPAVKKSHVDVSLHKNKLEINGKVEDEYLNEENLKFQEFKLFNYRRVFSVGNDIDEGKINASMENGVLTITLPKKEEVKPKKIEITVN